MARKKQSGKQPTHPNTLRDRAETLLSKRPERTPTLPTKDVQTLVHELNVYQMELEIQNEELRRSQAELAHTRDRYADLYEFAPVGYLTLDREGKITEANLAAAALLGAYRQELPGLNINKFVDREFQDECYLHRQDALDSDEKQVCEIGIKDMEGTPMVTRMESVAFDLGSERRLRMALIDITEQKRAEESLQRLNERLQHQAQTDDLTGLPNRAFFMTTYHQTFEHAKRHSRPLAIFMIDLNQFKQVNDDLGHAAGDRVLHTVATRLKEACRSGDILARIGGDEFILLVEDFDATQDLIHIAQKIGMSIEEPIAVMDRNYRLSLSIGIAFLEDGNINEETFLRYADDFMYKAKREGRLYYMGGR